MLEKFIEAKQKEVKDLKELEQKGLFPEPYKYEREKFKDALKTKKGIIAEYKRGSPSLGIINKNVSLDECVTGYKENGAIGVSILTEEKYFYSNVNFLQSIEHIKIPILRKDFIINPLQVKYTQSTCASGILIIVKLFKDKYNDLMYLIEYSKLCDLEPIVEVNNLQEMQIARDCGAEFILVNNRDLDTLIVDLNTSKDLIQYKKDKEIWICASGLNNIQDIKEMFHIGYDACLIGTFFMRQRYPYLALKEITSKLNPVDLIKRA